MFLALGDTNLVCFRMTENKIIRLDNGHKQVLKAQNNGGFMAGKSFKHVHDPGFRAWHVRAQLAISQFMAT